MQRLGLYNNLISFDNDTDKVMILLECAFFQRNKALYEEAIPLLMPQHHMVIPHYMGRSEEMEVEVSNVDNHKGIKRQDSFLSRSSYQDIPLLLPQEADGLDTPNGEPKPNGLNSSPNGLPFPFRKSKSASVGSDMPMRDFVEFNGKLASNGVMQTGIKHSDPEWWETQERGSQGGFTDESGQVGPRTSCRCQVGGYSSVLTFSYHLLSIGSQNPLLMGVSLSFWPAFCFNIMLFIVVLICTVICLS